jgi:hypothetical protein
VYVTFGPGDTSGRHDTLFGVFVTYLSQIPVPFEVAVQRLEPVLTELGGWAHEAYRTGELIRAKIGPGRTAPLLAKTVVLETGEPEYGHGLFTVPIAWKATGTPMLFPMMTAELRLVKAGDDITQIRLSGSYSVPFGSIGQIFDDALLHLVAESTVQNFVLRVAEAIRQ